MRRHLHHPPELHRQRERQHEDDERRPERGCERQQPVGGKGDGQRERREVRAAARRETRRLGRPAPCCGQAALLGSGDRAVLRAVQVQRAAAQDGEEQGERDGDAADRRPGRADEREGDRRQHRGQDQDTLTGLRYAAPPEHRRERGAEAHEPAGERQVVDGLRRLRHPTLADRAVDTGERPEALGDDHDAVRTRHAAETRQREGGVTAAEHGRCRIHTPVVSDKWAAPRGRDGPSFDAVESYESLVTRRCARRSRATRAPVRRSE